MKTANPDAPFIGITETGTRAENPARVSTLHITADGLTVLGNLPHGYTFKPTDALQRDKLCNYLQSLEFEPETLVIFRKFRGGFCDAEIVALFPEINAGHGCCESYMHVGQHGGADYSGVIAGTVPAQPEDYAPLAAELRGIGYRLKIRTRWNRKQSRRVNK